MPVRIAGLVGLGLFAAYVLYIALAIRTGATPIIIIGLGVTAIVAYDCWRGALRGDDSS
jgi:hypothetical protein